MVARQPRARRRRRHAPSRGVVHEGAHARFDVDVWIEAEGTRAARSTSACGRCAGATAWSPSCSPTGRNVDRPDAAPSGGSRASTPR